jgi:hypothetical protein
MSKCSNFQLDKGVLQDTNRRGIVVARELPATEAGWLLCGSAGPGDVQVILCLHCID